MIFRDSGAETTAKSLRFEEAKQATERLNTQRKNGASFLQRVFLWLSDR